MKGFIHEIRFAVYGFFVSYFISRTLLDSFDMNLFYHILSCILALLALFPMINKLDKTYVKRKDEL